MASDTGLALPLWSARKESMIRTFARGALGLAWVLLSVVGAFAQATSIPDNASTPGVLRCHAQSPRYALAGATRCATVEARCGGVEGHASGRSGTHVAIRREIAHGRAAGINPGPQRLLMLAITSRLPPAHRAERSHIRGKPAR